jgi:hypothetical protein
VHCLYGRKAPEEWSERADAVDRAADHGSHHSAVLCGFKEAPEHIGHSVGHGTVVRRVEVVAEQLLCNPRRKAEEVLLR